MPSLTQRTWRAKTEARRAARGPAAEVLARAGLTARGIIYLLIGLVAILVAVGQSGKEADQAGALKLLAAQPFGLFALWLLGLGFAAYALWRLSEAAFGVTGEGSGAGPRIKSAARAVIYIGFAVLTFDIIAGTGGSQAHREQDWSAKAMHQPGGRWLVGIIGLAVVIAGIVLIIEGVRAKFMRLLETSRMSMKTRALVVEAAINYQPSKARGLDKALLTLRHQPFGEALLIIAGLGLIVFGAYALCEARWHKV
jgi:hypothetical protein